VTDRPRPEFDRDAEATLSAFMDDYAAALVQRALAATAAAGDTAAISADALRAAAGGLAAMSVEEATAPKRANGVSPVVLGTVRLLRLGLAVSLLLAIVSATVVAGLLLPEAVPSTAARIWIGLGLVGALFASIAAISLYLIRTFGEDAIGGLLEKLALRQAPRDDSG
jgi:hypothetical protein